MSYNVKEANDNWSTLIGLVEKGHPQVIRRRGREVVIVVSIEDWKRVVGKFETKQDDSEN